MQRTDAPRMLVKCRLITSIVVFALTSGAWADAATPGQFPYPILERHLPNGLQVVAVPMPNTSAVSIQIVVLAGARHEVEARLNGLAHLFEHMVFRGQLAVPAQAQPPPIIGRQNAYTSDDFTNYFTLTTRDGVEGVLATYAARFRYLSYDEASFKTEAGAVMGEFNKQLPDIGKRLAATIRALNFQRHPYGHTALGRQEDLVRLPERYQESRNFFQTYYRPSQIRIVAAGDLVTDDFFRVIREQWGYRDEGPVPPTVPAEPLLNGPIYQHLDWESPTPPWLALSFRLPVSHGQDKHAVDLILDETLSPQSTLYRDVVLDRQWADRLEVDNLEHQDPFLVTISARLKSFAVMAAVRDAIYNALADVSHRGVTTAALARSRARYRAFRLQGLDDPAAVAGQIVRAMVFDGAASAVRTADQQLARITNTDLQRVARNVFRDRNLTVVTLSPQKPPSELPPIGSVDRFTRSTDESPIPGNWTVLPVGSPLIHLRLQFQAGSAQDPRGKEGVANLVGQLIASGASVQRSADELAIRLAEMGATFAGSVDHELVVFKGSVATEFADSYIDWVLERLLSPAWDAEDFDRLRAQAVQALTDRAQVDETLSRDLLYLEPFRGTRYGHLPIGRRKAVSRLSLSDLRNFYQQHYTQQTLSVGIAGRIPAGMVARLRDQLARLPRGSSEAVAMIGPVRSSVAKLLIVEKTTPTAAISIGVPLVVTRQDLDYPALLVAQTYLGHHRTGAGRLFQLLRASRGLTYGAYAYIDYFQNPAEAFFPEPDCPRRQSLFELWIRPVKRENAWMATKLAWGEFVRMADQGLTEAAFQSARTLALTDVALSRRNPMQRLGLQLLDRFFGKPGEDDWLRDRLLRLTVNDVNRAIERHLSQQSPTIVIVVQDGKTVAQEFIRSQGQPIVYANPVSAEIAAEDRAAAGLPLAIDARHVRMVRAEKLFE